jgi:hypothetical protein
VQRLIIPFLIAAYVGYGLVLAVFSRPGFPEAMAIEPGMPFLSDKPVGEDGYYMLTVAWYIAAGEGLQYNLGKITTGVQPLATFVYAGIAWLVQWSGGDRWTLARFVILFGTATTLANAWILGLIARRLSNHPQRQQLAFTLAFALVLGSAWLFRLHTYGLETGVYLVLLGACLLVTLHLPAKPEPRQVAAFGVLLGLTGLARIDFGVIAAGLLGWALVSRSLERSALFIAGAIAALLVAPWLYWVHEASGQWMPSSGTAQSGMITAHQVAGRAGEAFKALVQNLVPWAYTGGRAPLVGAAVFSLVALIALAIFRHVELDFSSQRRRWLLIWGAALFPLLVVYPTAFAATHFYGRYLAPLTVLSIPLLACLGAALLDQSRPVSVLGAHAALALIFCATSARTLHSGGIGNSHAVSAGVISRHVSEPVRVGAFQSGVIGYFNSNVFNLDGKIDIRALTYLRQQRIADYVDEERIDVMVDWVAAFEPPQFPKSYIDEHWTPCAVTIPNGASLCLRRKPTVANRQTSAAQEYGDMPREESRR